MVIYRMWNGKGSCAVACQYVFIALATLFQYPVLAAETKMTPISATQVEQFLSRHWDKPLAPQGDAPASFSPIEKSLSPDSCGACHQQQLKDWQGSSHAHAMGPGLIGQLVEMAATDRNQHQACLSCHAPLSEQADSLVVELARGTYDFKSLPPPDNSNKLHEQGMICAACHLRGYEMFGPPRKDGTTADSNDTTLPHGAWESTDAFEDSRFCSTCHQFGANGYALNGKLLENTYEEWKASDYPEKGVSCQSCHMPDRRHLWRGIHDVEMTRSGVTIETSMTPAENDQIIGSIKITNSNTGHYFPTYITPKILLQGIQLDQNGAEIAGSSQQFEIGRNLPLNLASENYDTRLAPGQMLEIDYEAPRAKQAQTLLLRVIVEPDEFYTRFYGSLLANNSARKQTEMIKQALANTKNSIYTLYETRYTIH
jgi:hypothetical protein